MNYPENVNMDLALNRPEPEFSHYELSYDGDIVEDKEFSSLSEAFSEAKALARFLTEDRGFNYETVCIEIAYEAGFENDVFKMVEYDKISNEWSVK